MSKKFKGLLLTDEIRGKLQVVVEEAIRCHFSALELDIKNREKGARKERIDLYKETAEACKSMIETAGVSTVGADQLEQENKQLKEALELAFYHLRNGEVQTRYKYNLAFTDVLSIIGKALDP